MLWPLIVTGVVALLLVGLIAVLLWPVNPDKRGDQ